MVLGQGPVEDVGVTPEFWSGRRVLVTGHTGFKGAWLALWLQSLGIKAVLPPPEEQKNVTTAIGAARAKNARDEMAS